MRGSIKKRQGKNGTSYQIIYDAGVKPDGKRIQKKETFRKKEEAEKRLREVLTQIDSGSFSDPGKITFGEFLLRWFKSTKSTWAKSTIENYQSTIDKHINPGLGKIALKKLNTLHIKEFLDKRSTQLSPATLNFILKIIKAALKNATEWQLISKNPATFVKSYKLKEQKVRFLKETEVHPFLDSLKNSKYYNPCYLAIFTGMRMGEILGLQWDAVDFQRKLIHVKQQLSRPFGGEFEFTEPKTKKSKRTIHISSEDVSFLKEHKKKQSAAMLEAGELWQKNNLVFL